MIAGIVKIFIYPSDMVRCEKTMYIMRTESFLRNNEKKWHIQFRWLIIFQLIVDLLKSFHILEIPIILLSINILINFYSLAFMGQIDTFGIIERIKTWKTCATFNSVLWKNILMVFWFRYWNEMESLWRLCVYTHL